jgi:hypothetical protein
MTEARMPQFSEEDFIQFRQHQMVDLISGKYQDFYSEWIMSGVLGEKFSPSVAIALFPMPHISPGHEIIVPQVLPFTQDHDSLFYYWNRIREMKLPQRAADYEHIYFAGLAGYEDEILKQSIRGIVRNFMPTAMVVFSRPTPEIKHVSDESAYLFCPTIVPPSAVYRHVIQYADIEMGKLSALS